MRLTTWDLYHQIAIRYGPPDLFRYRILDNPHETWTHPPDRGPGWKTWTNGAHRVRLENINRLKKTYQKRFIRQKVTSKRKSVGDFFWDPKFWNFCIEISMKMKNFDIKKSKIFEIEIFEDQHFCIEISMKMIFWNRFFLNRIFWNRSSKKIHRPIYFLT